MRRLLLLDLDRRDQRGGPVKAVLGSLSNQEKLGLAGSPYASVAELLDDCRAAVVQAVVDARPAVRDPAAYDALLSAAAEDQEARLRDVMAELIGILGAWRHAEKALSGRADLVTLPALTDLRAQLGRLVHRGFVGEAGITQLRRYPTYLAALEQRREKVDEQVSRDRRLMEQIADLQECLPAPGRGAGR